MKWLRAVLEIVHVFMHSYIEAAEAETLSVMRGFVYYSHTEARVMPVPFIHTETHAEHAG